MYFISQQFLLKQSKCKPFIITGVFFWDEIRNTTQESIVICNLFLDLPFSTCFTFSFEFPTIILLLFSKNATFFEQFLLIFCF